MSPPSGVVGSGVGGVGGVGFGCTGSVGSGFDIYHLLSSNKQLNVKENIESKQN